MVKRYLIGVYGEHQHPSGDFVHWQDYQAICAELDRANAALTRIAKGNYTKHIGSHTDPRDIQTAEDIAQAALTKPAEAAEPRPNGDILHDILAQAVPAALAEPAGEAEPVQVGWAYRDKRWDQDRWHVCGWEKPREHEGREVRPIFVLDTPPDASAIRGCATEGCSNRATVHFERGEVGSDYCHSCYMRVQALAGAKP